MIAAAASLATKIGSTIGAWIEAAYVLDCSGPDAETHQGRGGDLTWLPALSGVAVASARAIQSHADAASREA